MIGGRRLAGLSAALFALVALSVSAGAQSYPTKPVTIGNLEKLPKPSVAKLLDVNRTESKQEQTRIIPRKFRAI